MESITTRLFFSCCPGRSPPVNNPSPDVGMGMGSEVVEFIEPAQEFDISVDPGSRTALHLAVVHSHPQVVDILLNHKGR